MSENIIEGSLGDLTVADAVLTDDAEFVTDDPSEQPVTTLAEFADD